MAFSTTKQLVKHQSVYWVGRFLEECLSHITKVSRKPVTAKFLLQHYGGQVNLSDLSTLRDAGAYRLIRFEGDRIDRADVSEWLDSLNSLETL